SVRSSALVVVALAALPGVARSQDDRPWSMRVAQSVLWREPTAVFDKWDYTAGLVLLAMQRLPDKTRDPRIAIYVKRSIDSLVTAGGDIKTYRQADFTPDQINEGRVLFALAASTRDPRYDRAAATLHAQLAAQPRTRDGGFWHKQIYPEQMWLDGLYMAEPFYAQYAATFREDADFDDIAKQFILIERHTRDDQTGLLYHGWDESKQQRWADPTTGRSPNFWGRAMGWYGMALVDTLDYFPRTHPQRAELIAILKRFAAAVATYQPANTGLWYQVVDRAGAKGNYFESSAAAMFVYALAKGVHQNYLPASYLNVAEKGYRGILQQFVETKPNGLVDYKGTVSVAGLGGNPYRDGSYDYYLSEKVVTNDPKGFWACLIAVTEMEKGGRPDKPRR